MKFGASTFIWASPFSNATFHLIDKAAEMGFDILEVCVEDPATIDPAAIRQRLTERKLSATVCGAFGPDRDLTSDDPAVRGNALGYIDRCTAIAAELGAPAVIGPMYAAVGKTRMLEPAERRAQWALAAEGVKQAADHAAKSGIKLGVEPLNRFETDLLNTVDQAMEFLRMVDRENVGLLIDTFHMNIEERDIPAAIRMAGDRVVEFHACANDRGTPGKDHQPWPEIVRALADIRYDGPVVIEAFTTEIKEIARAVSIWRQLAATQDAIAQDGLKFLHAAFGR
ncbi:MAG: sugar phosphate isomerase/epimerase [Pseudomonadota bacterium]|nr:sugar phosphate isomerase/epimerase [Pseudomonadota bacterium]